MSSPTAFMRSNALICRGPATACDLVGHLVTPPCMRQMDVVGPRRRGSGARANRRIVSSMKSIGSPSGPSTISQETHVDQVRDPSSGSRPSAPDLRDRIEVEPAGEHPELANTAGRRRPADRNLHEIPVARRVLLTLARWRDGRLIGHPVIDALQQRPGTQQTTARLPVRWPTAVRRVRHKVDTSRAFLAVRAKPGLTITRASHEKVHRAGLHRGQVCVRIRHR